MQHTRLLITVPLPYSSQLADQLLNCRIEHRLAQFEGHVPGSCKQTTNPPAPQFLPSDFHTINNFYILGKSSQFISLFKNFNMHKTYEYPVRPRQVCQPSLAGALSCLAALAATYLEYEHPGCPYLKPSRLAEKVNSSEPVPVHFLQNPPPKGMSHSF